MQDFILGLKQTRADLTKSTDEKMTHSEQEVNELSSKFDEVMAVSDDWVEEQVQESPKV